MLPKPHSRPPLRTISRLRESFRIGIPASGDSRRESGGVRRGRTGIAIANTRCMLDREKVISVLRNHFPGASDDDAERAAGAIVGLSEDWEDVTSKEEELGYHYSPKCADICYLADQVDRGAEFRLFRRRRTRC